MKLSLSPCVPLALLSLTVLVGSGLAARPAQAQNLVTNPGFETGDFTGWTTVPAASGSDFFVTGNPHSGTHSAALGSVAGLDDSISQTLPTIAGDNYAVSFWLTLAGGTGNEFHATFGGNTLLQLQESPNFGYTQFSYTALATSSSTPLTFAGRTPPGFYYLDDISVTNLGPAAVPEASSTVSFGLLLALGLGGALVAARRRKMADAI